MLEAAPRLALLIQVRGVVGVHEDVRARLKFGEDPAFGLPRAGAGAPAADGLAGETGILEQLPGFTHFRGVRGIHVTPFGMTTNVLRGAVVGLEATEPQTGRLGDSERQFDRRLPRLHARARTPRVDVRP